MSSAVSHLLVRIKRLLPNGVEQSDSGSKMFICMSILVFDIRIYMQQKTSGDIILENSGKCI